MKTRIVFILCLILSVSSISCIYGTNNFFYYGNDVDKRVDYLHELDDFETRCNSSNSESFPKKYKILVITDTHFGSPLKTTETAKFYNWLTTINSSHDKPKFCFILGDNVDRGYESEYVLFADYVKHIEDAGIPVLSILGNHDLYNSGWDVYLKYCEPKCSLFHFDTPVYSWYAIDTGTGNIGMKQYKMIKKAFVNDPKKKIVLSHYPLTNSKWLSSISMHDSTERNLLVDLYSRTNVTDILCGHLHQINYADLGTFREYGHPSFCYSDAPAWTLYEVDETDKNRPKIIQLPRDF